MHRIMRAVLVAPLLAGLSTVAVGESRHEQDVERLLGLASGAADLPRSKVMLLGTFHFKDAGLDEYKPLHQLDILGEKRQKEIGDIVERLASYRPTRIGVEWKADKQASLDKRYQAYLQGEHTLTPNESDQLGLRLAGKLGHKRIYAIDANGAWIEPRVDIEAYAKEHGQTDRLQDPYLPLFFKAASIIDELKTQRTIRETLLMKNDPRMVSAGHGVYLTRTLSVGDATHYPGVDGFLSHWYNRNLRIFANIQRTTDGSDERVLVIIGAGHLPILRHAVRTSPEFELVEVAEFLE